MELTNQFPVYVVCAWLGNPPQVAHWHYLRVTDDHFQRAVQGGADCGANAPKTVHPELRQNKTPKQAFASKNTVQTLHYQRKKSLPTVRRNTLAVDLAGLEPAASTMSTWRSSQLSYRSI